MSCEQEKINKLLSAANSYVLEKMQMQAEIQSLRQQLADTQRKLEAALSTEAQPEVTGAVAWLVVDAKNAHLLDSGQGFLRGDEAYSKDPYWATKPLYPPSAIEAAVREKLEAAALIAEAYREVTDGQSMYIADKIRALMEPKS